MKLGEHVKNSKKKWIFISLIATLLTIVISMSFVVGLKALKSSQKRRLVDSMGIEFVLIPAGEFQMGSEESVADLIARYPNVDPKRLEVFGDEAPVHRVQITRDFYLGTHEVTLGQFKAFLRESGYVAQSIAEHSGAYGYSAEHDANRPEDVDAFDECKTRYSYADPGWPQSDNHPVVNISWNDAQALVAWLSQKEGVRYRLPTEAEWEYACRAGASTQYAFGNDPEATVKHGNVFDLDATPFWKRWLNDAAQGHDGFPFTAPVGNYPPNAFGIHDMTGNVWEWVSDWYGEDYYAKSPPKDPQGPASGTKKIRRGGSFHTWPIYARCGFRNWITPSSRYTLIGMRLLREIPTNSHAQNKSVDFAKTVQSPTDESTRIFNKDQVKNSSFLSKNFDRINADKDCTIDQAEIDAYKVMVSDKNNDGALDKSEIKHKQIFEQFELLDKDKNGSLDRSEVLYFFRKKH